MYYAQHFECPSCHQVLFDPELKLTRKNEPAPCCGAYGEARGVWPWHGADKFLKLVHDLDLKDFDDRRVAIIFLASALEFLIELSLWELLTDFYGTRKEISEAILDGHRGIKKRMNLYNRLSGDSLERIFSANGFTSFYSDWRQLIELRNGIAHGRYYKSVSDEAEMLHRIRDFCIGAFATVHNEMQIRIQEMSRDD